MDDELLAELIKRAQEQLRRRSMPDMAGDMAPATMRAVNTMRKTYPVDMMGVKVGETPMLDPDAFSNIQAGTPSGANKVRNLGLPPPDYESIHVNPAVSAGFPQSWIESVLAHELQHVRQNRTMDPREQLRQHVDYAYDDRPIEVEARIAADKFDKERPQEVLTNEMRQRMIVNELGNLFAKRKKR